MGQKHILNLDAGAADVPNNQVRIKNDIIQNVVATFRGLALNTLQARGLRRNQTIQPLRLLRNFHLERLVFLLLTGDLRLKVRYWLGIFISRRAASHVE